jgi:hypothetical protein
MLSEKENLIEFELAECRKLRYEFDTRMANSRLANDADKPRVERTI